MSRLSAESNALYNACLDATTAPPEEKLFDQAELMKLSNRNETQVILLVNELMSHRLIRSKKQQGQTLWLTRPRRTAASMAQLSEGEQMIFGHVEDSGTVGIWVKKIKQVTNIPPSDVQKMINKLERLHLIKGVKSVKSPAQRIYMLWNLVPSDDVTGGSFFDAGDLDESLVDELGRLIVWQVRAASWSNARRRYKHESTATHDNDDDSADAGARPKKKRKRDVTDIEDAAPPATKHRPRAHSDSDNEVSIQLAHPVSTVEYPTTEVIHGMISKSNALRAAKADSLTVPEVQTLIDVLVWDEKLEKVGNGYRTVRGIQYKLQGPAEPEDGIEDHRGNGLTEVPCCKCPVFDLCKDGGPVNAASCVYYTEWLKA